MFGESSFPGGDVQTDVHLDKTDHEKKGLALPRVPFNA